ncbi:hypothetical protein ACYT69_13130, partial [Streptococcus pyogenes]
ETFEQLMRSKEITLRPTKKQQTDDILKRLLNKRKRGDEPAEESPAEPAEPEEELDDYDQLITDMMFDARLQASDRT